MTKEERAKWKLNHLIEMEKKNRLTSFLDYQQNKMLSLGTPLTYLQLLLKEIDIFTQLDLWEYTVIEEIKLAVNGEPIILKNQVNVPNGKLI